jgi:hypothetical protein
MPAQSAIKTAVAECRCHCGSAGEFGYRDKVSGEMTWYCVQHRLAQWWADAGIEKPGAAAAADTAVDGPPDLQALVAAHGGYDKITPEAWAAYDAAMAEWQEQRRDKFRRR